ncbi:MAG: acyl--CoA ligase [Granulosicoccus sp.]|nr:acyl--CoA ligase [Granulosicoccus sp.]
MSDATQIPVLTRISEYVSYHAANQPETEALVLRERRIDYQSFAEEIKRYAKALIFAGVTHGDRIAMLGAPRPEFMLLLMATVDIGAIWMGMHPRYRMREFRHVVGLAKPKLIFAFDEIDGRHYTSELEALNAEFDCVENIILFDSVKAPEFCLSANEFLERADQINDNIWLQMQQAVATDDPAVIIFTSGTTGEPKGAMNSHFGLIHGAHVERRHWPGEHIRVLQNMPINHIANIGMMSSYCLVSGGTLVFQDRFDPGDLLSLIEQEEITFWLQSPVQFHLTAAHKDFDSRDISSLQYMIWGGGPMPQYLVEKLSKIDAKLATAYGMTELTAYVTFSDLDEKPEVLANSIGRPEQNYALRLMKADGSEAQAGEEGEIQAKGRWIMRGYFDQPIATQEAFTDDGWFHTGDVAIRLDDGNWRLVGRTKEMYKSGGFNIYPREIEIVMEEHPAVALTAVLSVSDLIYDEVGYAFIQPYAGAKVTEEEIRDWCKERLANYKVPKTFEFLESLPTLPIGKIDKQALRRKLDSASR